MVIVFVFVNPKASNVKNQSLNPDVLVVIMFRHCEEHDFQRRSNLCIFAEIRLF